MQCPKDVHITDSAKRAGSDVGKHQKQAGNAEKIIIRSIPKPRRHLLRLWNNVVRHSFIEIDLCSVLAAKHLVRPVDFSSIPSTQLNYFAAQP